MVRHDPRQTANERAVWTAQQRDEWKQQGEKLLEPVINAVLVVDMEELVFNPGNLFRGLPPSFSLQ